MKKLPLPTVLTAGALLLVLLAYAVTFQVRFNQTAVRVVLGRADESSIVRQPGPYLRWPWPIEQIVKYDQRLQGLDTPEGEATTHDNKNLIVGCYAIWQVADPLKFYKVVLTQRSAEQQIRARVNEARQTVIGRYDMSAFVNPDENALRDTYDKMESEMKDLVAPGLAADYGIRLDRVGLRRISLPESATAEVFRSMSQERDKLATRYREEGNSLKSGIESRAKAAADKILAFAESKAKEIESEGGRASRAYLEQIAQADSEFFIFLRELETLEAVLKSDSTIFFDAQSELFRKFMQSGAPASPDLHARAKE